MVQFDFMDKQGTLYTPNNFVVNAEILRLRELIDDDSYMLLDLKETNNCLNKDVKELKEEIASLNSVLQLAADRQVQSDNEKNNLQCQIQTLTAELESLKKNKEFADDHIKGLNRNIELAKDNLDKLHAEKVNNEHMAKKLLELNQRNETLETRIVRFTAENGNLAIKNYELENEVDALTTETVKLKTKELGLAEEVKSLKEENDKFKEQTTRLLNENSTYCCPGAKAERKDSLCGGCLTCLLQQSEHNYDILAKNLESAVKERTYYQTEFQKADMARLRERLGNDNNVRTTHAVKSAVNLIQEIENLSEKVIKKINEWKRHE